MTEPTQITLAEDLHANLTAFKPIFDTIIEEAYTFEEYANIVLSIGLDKMLRDAIPEGQEWSTLEVAFAKHYDLMCTIVNEIWEQGAQVEAVEREAIKHKIG